MSTNGEPSDPTESDPYPEADRAAAKVIENAVQDALTRWLNAALIGGALGLLLWYFLIHFSSR